MQSLVRIGATFATTILVASCASSDDGRVADDHDPPIKMAPATTTASQYLQMYKALCLKTFPRHESTRNAARQLGFREVAQSRQEVRDPLDLSTFVNKEMGLSLSFGNSVLFEHYADGGWDTRDITLCTLKGHIVDPENLNEASVRKAYGRLVILMESEGKKNKHDLQGKLENESGDFRFHFELPYTYEVRSDSSIIGADRCELLSRCTVWREPKFETSIGLYEY